MEQKNIGTVTQIMGPVLDIKFPDGHLPDLLNAITVQNGDGDITVEVAQHVGDNVVRCIAMASTCLLYTSNGAPVYFAMDILGGIPFSATLVVTWGIMVLLTGLCIWMTRDLKVAGISKKQAVAEFLVTTAENFVNNNMGAKWANFVPFVACLLYTSRAEKN